MIAYVYKCIFINSEGGRNTGVVYFIEKDNKDYYDAAMRQITGDSWSLSAYGYLKSNEEWIGRYEDFLKGRKSLPLLYDPFFKKIFNPVERRDRLSELVSCLLGQKVTVLEVFRMRIHSFLA